MLKSVRLFLPLAILSGCVALNTRMPAGYTAENYATKIFSPRPLEFKLSNVDALKPKTVEDILAAIPETVRMNYALIYESGSLQDASYAHPRALMFSDTADLVVSFNSGEQAGGNALEAIEYNSSTEQYDFHEFEFSSQGMVHRINDKKCQACHTADNVPLWRGYADWRGVYGASHNDFNNKTVDAMERDFATQNYVDAKEDLKNFKEFAKAQGQHPRYKYLLRPDGEPLWPFSKNVPGLHSDPFDYNPNRRLGIGLMFHVARSAALKVSHSQLFKNYPANIVYTLLNCGENDASKKFMAKLSRVFDSLPHLSGDSSYSMYRQPGSNEMLVFLSVAGVLPYNWVVDPSSRMTNPLSPTILDMGFGEMSYTNISGAILLYEKLKPAMGNSISPDGPTQTMSENMGAPVPFIQILNKISPLYSVDKIRVEVCPSLESKMKTEIRQEQEIAVELGPESLKMLKARADGEPYVLRRCISCHAQGNFRDAPSIAFDLPSEYSLALSAQAALSNEPIIREIEMRTQFTAPSSYRMPKGAFGLDPNERARLLKYLNSTH